MFELREDTETIVRYDATSKNAFIWTADSHEMERLEKLGAKCVRPSETNAVYSVPRSWVKVRPPQLRLVKRNPVTKIK